MWFWLITAITGSIVGSATESWFRDTKMGVWFYAKVDGLYTWANMRYGLKILTEEEERMKKFPMLSKRLEEQDTKIKQLEHLIEYVGQNRV